MSIIIAGFLLGISLIVAIGPQNALVIRQGIKRQALIAVMTVCILSDIILMSAGTAGMGVLIERAPSALTILKWLGVAYLAWFGYSCFKDAINMKDQALVVTDSEETHWPSQQTAATPAPTQSAVTTKVQTMPQTKVTSHPVPTWLKPVLAALAFTWLNPATYIDTLVMIGGMANQYGVTNKWLFNFGAISASFLWFPLLGFGAAKFSSILSQPKAWRFINVAIGCIMVCMCIRLILH